jgi:hypothetical protein
VNQSPVDDRMIADDFQTDRELARAIGQLNDLGYRVEKRGWPRGPST